MSPHDTANLMIVSHDYDSDKRYHPRLPDEAEPIKAARNVEQEQTIEYWRNQAKATVEKHMDTSKSNFVFPAMLPKDSETHGGEDVAVYASGPWSHLFTGSYEQNVLPHMMAYASCIGRGMKACD
uniref:alkaline phosphatase n=1 Tax=Anopheles coluzzii TaxID=1518534 RepID=A0A8W7PUE2_ANOCL